MADTVGTVIFRGSSGQAYIKDIVPIDTAGALHRWDGGAGASTTSPDFWVPPENVTLVEYIQVAAMAALRTSIDINNTPTGNILRNILHTPSATMINRPYIGYVIPAGVKVSLRSLA